MTIGKLPEKIRHQIQSIKNGEWLFDWQRQAPTQDQLALLDILTDSDSNRHFDSTEKMDDKGLYSFEITKAALLRMKLTESHEPDKTSIQQQLVASLEEAALVILQRVESVQNDEWSLNALLHIYGFVVLGNYKSDSFTRVKDKCHELKLLNNLLEIPELTPNQINVLRVLGYKHSEGKAEEGFDRNFELAHAYLNKSFVSAKELLALNQSSGGVTLWHIGLTYTLILENAIKQQTNQVPLSDQQQQYLQQSLDSNLSQRRQANCGSCFGFFSTGDSCSSTDAQPYSALDSKNHEIENLGLQEFSEKQPILLLRLIQIQLIETLRSGNTTTQELGILKSNVSQLLMPRCLSGMFNCFPILDKHLSERLRLLKSCHQNPSPQTNWPAELKDISISGLVDELFVPVTAYLNGLSSAPHQLVVNQPHRT